MQICRFPGHAVRRGMGTSIVLRERRAMTHERGSAASVRRKPLGMQRDRTDVELGYQLFGSRQSYFTQKMQAALQWYFPDRHTFVSKGASNREEIESHSSILHRRLTKIRRIHTAETRVADTSWRIREGPLTEREQELERTYARQASSPADPGYLQHGTLSRMCTTVTARYIHRYEQRRSSWVKWHMYQNKRRRLRRYSICHT